MRQDTFMTSTGLDGFPAEFKPIIEFQACLSIIGLKLIRASSSFFFSTLLDSFSYSFFTLHIPNYLSLSLPGPRWASWNLGIFICIRCAGIHRNLGVHISKVKSVNLDQWTQEQVQVRGRSTDTNITMGPFVTCYCVIQCMLLVNHRNGLNLAYPFVTGVLQIKHEV